MNGLFCLGNADLLLYFSGADEIFSLDSKGAFHEFYLGGADDDWGFRNQDQPIWNHHQ